MSALQHIIQRFEKAMKALKINYSSADVERMGFLVDEAMSGSARSFHTPQHIFDILKDEDPYRSLAALFHDVVYYQVDNSITDRISQMISPFIRLDGTSSEFLTYRPHDFCYEMCMTLFGFSHGKNLTLIVGLNEFLSCLAAMKSLEPFLTRKDLVKIAVCIEATIPFRSGKGSKWIANSKMRLKKVSKTWNLGLKEKEIEEMLKSAVLLSNWDVSNFAEDEIGRFLDNTWKIIIEGNGSLHSQKIYTVKDYRIALDKMEKFFTFIRAEKIHNQYLGAPGKKEFATVMSNTRRNLKLGKQYLGIKLLTILVIESLALVTGGDVPVSLFMGDSSSTAEEGGKFRKWLPFKKKTPTDVNLEVLVLLESGRAMQSEFDSKASLLSAFIYRSLGKDGVEELLVAAKKMSNGKMTPEQFLRSMPMSLLKPIAKACSEIAPTRRQELLKVV